MGKKLKVAAYCRVSTEQDSQINSLESQKQYFASYIAENPDWELAEVYYDEGISGTQSSRRPSFNRMLRDAYQGNIDLILTKEVSRFARNTVDALSFTRKLKEHHVGVIFTLDNIDTRDTDGELRLTIMASLAQEESRKTSERVKWGQKRRMEQGVVFGRDLIGYRVQKGKLLINEKELPVVRAIFHKYTNEGKGTHVIARELLEEGFYPKYGDHWSNVTILRMLRNEKYVGDLCQKKTYTPDYLTHKKKENNGQEEKIYLRNHHEPIIDRDLWNRTQMEIKCRHPDSKQKTKHSNRYWASGKLLCSVCGRHFVPRINHRKDGTSQLSWRCSCHTPSVNEQTLLTCMRYCLQQSNPNLDQIKTRALRDLKKIQSFSANTDENREIIELQKEHSRLEENYRKLIDLWIGKCIEEKEFTDQKQWYQKQFHRLNQERAKYNEKLEVQYQFLSNQSNSPKSMDEILESSDNSKKFFHQILDYIMIHPNHTMDIYFKELTFGFHLIYQNHGRGNSFHTDVTFSSYVCR